MGFFGNFFLWTCFHSFFSQTKKKVIFHWVQIVETLVLSFLYNGSQKCLSQRSDWDGPFSFLWWVHWNSLNKKSLKKKNFSKSFHWIQIGETLVLSFSYNGLQKCLSHQSDWKGPFPSLWWVHWRSSKKKKFKKKKLFKFLSLDSNWRNFGSFLFVQWLAEMFEPTFGLGGAISLSLVGPLEIF